MHRTTINLPEALHVRLRHMAERSGKSLGQLLAELVLEALSSRSRRFASHASGDAAVDDLGLNAERYLREGLS